MAVTLARDNAPADPTLLGVLVAPIGEALTNLGTLLLHRHMRGNTLTS